MNKIFWFMLFFISLNGMSYADKTTASDSKSLAVLIFKSNSIDLHIADIDVKRNKLIQTVFFASEKVLFKDDFDKNRRASIFSSNIQDKALDSLKKLLKKAESFKTTALQGFAIDIFREAKNADELIKRIKEEAKINVSILSEKQQGIVEFIAIVNELKLDPEKTITWNMDWQLFRLTAKCEDDYAVYIGKIHQKIFSDVIDLIENTDKSKSYYPIPLTEQGLNQEKQIVKSLLKDIPQCIRDKGALSESIGFGYLGFGYNLPKHLLDDHKMRSQTIQQALKSRTGKWDERSKSKDMIAYPSAMLRNVYGFALADLILFSGVMDALNIQNLEWTSTKPELTVGCLLYPKFWN